MILGKRILMIVDNLYPQDTRVRKEAATLTEAGYSVTVIGIQGAGQKLRERIDQVAIYRIPKIDLFKKIKRDGSSILQLLDRIKSVIGFFLEHAYFTIASLWVSLYIALRHGFDVLHTHNPPDTLSVIGAIYRLLGKKYVYDHHDLSPELYLARVSGKRDLIYRGLLFFERLSCLFSNVIISTNESYRQIEIGRHSIDPRKIFIVRNNPDPRDCAWGGEESHTARNENGKTVLLFLGSINPQDGVDTLLVGIHYLVNRLNEREFVCQIVGDGDSLESVKQLSAELGLENYVDFKGRISDREKVKEYIRSADIGVEPAPFNAANQHSTFIKVMEFMAACKPVVAFDLKETRYSAGGGAVLIPPGDIEGFSWALKRLIADPTERMKLGKTGFRRIENELGWEKASHNLKTAYESLEAIP